MHSKRTMVMFVLGLISILLIAAFLVAPATQAGSDNRSDRLHGSWSVVITTPGQGAFPALLTFMGDGSVIADESPAPFESTGHGNWVNRGHGEVGYTFVALYGSEQGANTGKLKVTGTLQYDEGADGWRGPFKIDIFDAGGQMVFTDRGTFSLTRIAVEPLP
jgi:hypothetical protein